MDFELPDEVEEFRGEVHEFLAHHLDHDVMERMEATGTYYDKEFAKALAAKGWIGFDFREGDNGWLKAGVLTEEFGRAHAPVDWAHSTMLAARAIRRFGTPEQLEVIESSVLGGDLVIALGYSEAGSGSDVAAARTRAQRDGDDWLINGEKMFTTMAERADYVFLLTRTNNEVPKHRGLTMFLVPMSSPGISVAEIKTLGGERTNVTSYEDVRVSDQWRVGPVDQGWAVLTGALDEEHAGNVWFEIDRVLRAGAEQAAEVRPDGTRLIDDPTVRARLARIAVEVEVAELLSLRANWMMAVGQTPVAEGPMAKLFASEALARACGELIDMLAPESLLSNGTLEPSGAGVVEHAYRHSQVVRIYGGTSEIHRSLIAERGLGLPRSRARS